MKKCLIVDDAEVIRKVVHAILTGMQFTVFEADNTEAALALCEKEIPDVVILDWHIPHCDSLEFLAQLRSMPSGDRPKVIYLTTETDPDVISAAQNATADDYLIKPFDRATLIKKFTDLKLAA